MPALRTQARKQGIDNPIDRPCTVVVSYFMPNRAAWPDLVGLMQATADLLEAAGVLENDRLITSWDGTDITGISKVNPRAAIVVIPEWLEYEPGTQWKLDPMTKRRLESGYYED